MYKKLFINKTLQNNEFKQIISLLEQKNISISFVETKTDFTDKDNALFIGINAQDSDLSQELNIDFALATWCCRDFKHIQAKYYFRQPYDILNTLTMIEKPYINHKWLTTAMEMQFIAQAGLAYTKDDFDYERFTRLSEMAAEIMSEYVDLPVEKVKTLFCNETGYQTPKLDTRSVIFKDDKILLVKERDGRWSLPGGWVDVNQSICDNLIKEAKEEAVARLRYLSDKVGEDMKISLEFCGAPNCSINQFGTAYDVVKAVDRPNVGITVDTFHFHEMCSKLEDLKKADGNKIFAYHLNDCEDLPLGSCGDDKRLWPGEGVVDHEGIATALKEIGFDGVCTIEEFRPEYYAMSHEENIKKAAEVTKAFVNKYFG